MDEREPVSLIPKSHIEIGESLPRITAEKHAEGDCATARGRVFSERRPPLVERKGCFPGGQKVGGTQRNRPTQENTRGSPPRDLSESDEASETLERAAKWG